MFDYLQKFNNLPKSLRDKVSSPEAMKKVSDLEGKYKVDLAAVVMKVMTKNLTTNNLVDYFISEFSFSAGTAEDLKNDILREVFSSVADYLNIAKDNGVSKSDDSDINVKEIGVSLPSDDLYTRLYSILKTYKKGVRSEIDTRDALMKGVEFGGLGLDIVEVDRIINFFKFGENKKKEEPILKEGAESSREKLNKIIMQAEANFSPAYDFKKSILEKNTSLAKVEEKKLLEVKDKNLLSAKPDNILLNSKNEEVKKEEFIPKDITPSNLPLADSEETKKPIVDKIETEKTLEAKKEEVKKEEVKKEEVKKEEVKKEGLIKKDVSIEVGSGETLNLNFNRPAINSSKLKIHDIRPIAKIVSPIDELRLLDLDNFHRLGENTKEIVLKIFSRIKLLEKDGYDKMIEGVKAWRQSEVNRLYIKMGQEVLLKNISLEEVIKERQKNNLPYLKPEEISAISQLNSRLSF